MGHKKYMFFILRSVVNLDLITVTKRSVISKSRIPKIQGEIKLIDKIDSRSLKLLKSTKSSNDPIFTVKKQQGAKSLVLSGCC